MSCNPGWRYERGRQLKRIRHSGTEGNTCQLVQISDKGCDHTPISDLREQLNQVFAPLLKLLGYLCSGSINVD
jgi:hypothetical protein